MSKYTPIERQLDAFLRKFLKRNRADLDRMLNERIAALAAHLAQTYESKLDLPQEAKALRSQVRQLKDRVAQLEGSLAKFETPETKE